jgi:CelD/BcsL family acetyltransferase involved in cellulose biosynthesis
MDELTLTTSVVADTDGFRQLAAEWDGLLEQSAQRTYFLRWHWNWLWWTHFAPPGARLHVICCRDVVGALAGIAPLYLVPRPVLSVIPMHELQLMGTGVATRTSEYMDIVARHGCEGLVAGAVAKSLSEFSGWDRLCLHGVPAEGAVSAALVAALGLDCRATPCDRAPYVDTSKGWNAYKATLGKSMRRNVDYYPRRLFQQHACSFERAATERAVHDGLDDLIRLHQARWQAAGAPGSFSNPAVLGFVRSAAEDACQSGRLRLWRLTVDGVVEAALIGFADAGTVHYFQTGFNPAMARADLGTVIMALSIKDCCEDPEIRVFDFMGGVGYKSMWAREERILVRHESWRSNVRTFADRAWKSSREATARVYRAAAPAAIRRWRTERVKSKA